MEREYFKWTQWLKLIYCSLCLFLSYKPCFIQITVITVNQISCGFMIHTTFWAWNLMFPIQFGLNSLSLSQKRTLRPRLETTVGRIYSKLPNTPLLPTRLLSSGILHGSFCLFAYWHVFLCWNLALRPFLGLGRRFSAQKCTESNAGTRKIKLIWYRGFRITFLVCVFFFFGVRFWHSGRFCHGIVCVFCFARLNLVFARAPGGVTEFEKSASSF